MARTILHVPIGEMRVSTEGSETLYSCVGSCCAVTLYDSENKIAGMVHIVLPGNRTINRAGDRNCYYADTGIPLLIAEMEMQGSTRNRLNATVVGGASLVDGGETEIGSRNVEHVLSLLKNFGIPVTKQDTGGTCVRSIEICACSGQLQISQTSVKKVLSRKESGGLSLTESELDYISKTATLLRPNPQVAQKLFSAIHETIIDWGDVKEIIFHDVVLALQIFRMCNSSYYGVPHKIDSLHTALVLLGENHFRRVCVVAAATRNSDLVLDDWGVDQETLSAHCLASATKSCQKGQGQSFVIGFFLPLGSVLSRMISKLRSDLSSSLQDDSVFSTMNENENILQYSNLTASLLCKWNFPKRIIDGVASAAQAPAEYGEMRS